MKEKKIIGRADKADFPELQLEDIDIKIDTGAYTSSIHCSNIQKKLINDKYIVSFNLLDASHSQYNNKEFISTNFKEKVIKNSFGNSESRYVIKTNIILFEKKYVIELSLSERGEMRFPVLIGRKVLLGKFIVDPSEKDLSYKNKVDNLKK